MTGKTLAAAVEQNIALPSEHVTAPLSARPATSYSAWTGASGFYNARRLLSPALPDAGGGRQLR
ncbi:hypothetical protein AB0M95_32750 [Sphaerisporangium sp. NPDC051017]|uniref:hypothetical protein n=1 Tax=Sphaerisporangium sp. NPDC051017 TaxID=3154636 RepID=UPI0034439BC6